MFRGAGLNILGKVGTHILFYYFYFIFFWKKYNFMHFESVSLFKMYKIIFFLEYFFLGFTSKFKQGTVTLLLDLRTD